MLRPYVILYVVGSTIIAQAFATQINQPPPISQEGYHNRTKRPNFVMIMTDDQDLHLNSLDYQPAVLKHFVTMAQCCPSRVSLWTGMAGHNTNVTDIQPPFGKEFLYNTSQIKLIQSLR